MSFIKRVAILELKIERRPQFYLRLAIVLFVACFGPWLLTHFRHLWGREHYQFFPMMLLAVVGLCYGCWSNAAQHGLSMKSLKFSTPLFVLATLTLSGAFWINSPWLAYLTTLLILWLILRNVPFGCSSIVPLFVLLPLPFTMDGELVHGLQRVSSRGASALLDLASIRHLMSGNVLELPDKNFFVEEACSGIGSVFLLLASAAVYTSWRQLRLVVTIPLLISAVFWAVAGNTFRIFSVAWAHENLQVDLSSGSQHDLLGTATYLMSLVLLSMTEQALLFLFEPVGAIFSTKASNTKTQTLAATMSRFWDDLTSMDPEVRMDQLLARHVSGFRVTSGRFLALLILFFCLGCAGNIASFWPTIQAAVRNSRITLAATESNPTPVVSPAPSSVLSPFRSLTPNILARISGLSIVSPAAAVTPVTDQAAPANGIQSAETAPSDYPQRLEMKANGLVAGEKDSGIHRLEWALEFAETPVLLIINGPHRVDDARALTSRKISDHGEVDTWITTESASVPLADVANDLPVLLDQTLKNSSGQFRHELTAEFTQVASLMPMDEIGSLSAMQRQFSPGISGEDTNKGQWYWRFTLRFESDRPVPSTVRPARLAVFESILTALLEHWRTAA